MPRIDNVDESTAINDSVMNQKAIPASTTIPQRRTRGLPAILADLLDKLANRVRKTSVYRSPSDGMGISVTGGLEHGVPIMISEILPGQLAHQNGNFFVGDAILSVNGIDLRDKRHHEAVQILSAQQVGLQPTAGLRVQSPRYSPGHQTEDVQARRLDDTPLRNGHLDRILEPSEEAESLPSQLPTQNTEAEMTRQDSGHGSPGADRNPQHPRHTEAIATAMERPPGENG
ncbi:unnamed protein product [Schistocephalus solidus]|uniref:PDZ domain-containing protein n=1 Tax=Schistocephalus solidus TaxID=70667 RepID=A0A183T9N8_SCHSO|nr:unnamed protein product [Schistocephalus solidus]